MASVAPTNPPDEAPLTSPPGLPRDQRLVKAGVEAVAGARSRRPRAAAGMRLGTLALIFGAALVALFPSAGSIVEVWRNVHDYQHGYFIALVAVVWIAVESYRGRHLGLRFSPVGALALAGALFAWLVALGANSLMLHQILFPVTVWLALYACAGWPLASRLLAPIAYLYFAMPIWDYAVPWLQRMSVIATEGLLGAVGVPATVREYSVTIPEGTFRIVEGCSGKRYFMVTLAVGFLAAAINHVRGTRLAVYLVACALLALVANWLRIAIVIYAGHATDMQHYFVEVEHETLGHAIFAVLLVAVLFLSRWPAPANAPSVTPAEGLARNATRPDAISTHLPATLPLILLASTLAIVLWRQERDAEAPSIGNLPIATGVWQGPLPGSDLWQPHYVGPEAERRASYASSGSVVELYVNLYGEQRQGRELVFFGNTLLRPEGWQRAWPLVTTPLPAQTSGGNPGTFQARAPDGSPWIVAYVYKVGGFATTSELMAQVAYGMRSMMHPVPSGVIALATSCEPNCDAAQALVVSFWEAMSAPVMAVIPDDVQR